MRAKRKGFADADEKQEGVTQSQKCVEIYWNKNNLL